MTFIERLNELCAEKHISKRTLEREAGLGTASTSKWNTVKPNQESLTKISKYFGVSVSYLIGESEFRTDRDAMIERWKTSIDQSALAEDVRKIEAGIRIPVIESIDMMDDEPDDWIEISEKLSRQGQFFAFKVTDDSMSPRICSGDVLVVLKQNHAESGDVVVVLTDQNETMCRRIVKSTLIPFNTTFEPTVDHFQIIGKVVENRQSYT